MKKLLENTFWTESQAIGFVPSIRYQSLFFKRIFLRLSMARGTNMLKFMLYIGDGFMKKIINDRSNQNLNIVQ